MKTTERNHLRENRNPEHQEKEIADWEENQKVMDTEEAPPDQLVQLVQAVIVQKSVGWHKDDQGLLTISFF